MTDLEMTRLCAEAMAFEGGITVIDKMADDPKKHYIYFESDDDSERPSFIYDPLHDDAQAMALVKKFGANICQNMDRTNWYASITGGSACGKNLNLAIVECVAKMQQAKQRKAA